MIAYCVMKSVSIRVEKYLMFKNNLDLLSVICYSFFELNKLIYVRNWMNVSTNYHNSLL